MSTAIQFIQGAQRLCRAPAVYGAHSLRKLPRAGKLRQASLPRVPLRWQHDVRFKRSAAFCCSQSRPPACGLFPCARHRPRQPRTAVMCAADPVPGRPPASGLVPLKNAAWLSCAVREPINIFYRGKQHGYTTLNTSNRFQVRQRQRRHLGEHRRERPFFYVSFSRLHKDAQGNWKNSSSYGLNDLDSLSTLAEMAKDWVRGHSRP